MRKVVITGATSGFGKLLVEAFLKNGDFVIATGRKITQRTELFALARQIYSRNILEVDLDVTQENQISEALKIIEHEVGEIDILINNAGFGQFGALEDLSEKEIRHQMEVNFFGLVAVTKAFLPSLRTNQGKIFNFSSVFGFMGFPLTSLYCASKYAVEGLTESLRGELAPFGVQVCLIEPGGYRTNFSENISWGPENTVSLYSSQLKNYKKLHETASKRKPQEPIEVARGVLKLSEKKKLPMRKVFGVDATASYLLKNALPAFFYYLLLDLFFKRAFSKKT